VMDAQRKRISSGVQTSTRPKSMPHAIASWNKADSQRQVRRQPKMGIALRDARLH
jgi:hypothetical protein